MGLGFSVGFSGFSCDAGVFCCGTCRLDGSRETLFIYKQIMLTCITVALPQKNILDMTVGNNHL